MKILSWNVNGIRAIAKKGFLEWLEQEQADIICLQETKSKPDQLTPELLNPHDYYSFWNSAERAGYAGVGLYSKTKPLKITQNPFNSLNKEGRVLEAHFPDFILLNIYFPNGSTRADGTEMLSVKLKFYDDFLNYIKKLHQENKKVVVCGDFNVAHQEIDIARPAANKNSIGFLPVERDKMTEMQKELVDVFRYFNPKQKDAYTWWSYRAAARERNVGWRLDYFLISPALLPQIRNIVHQIEIMGSDHCPVKLQL